MRRGEDWRVRLPPATGHAQAGERPAIVVQSDGVTPHLPTVLIVPLTGATAAQRFPGTVVIDPDPQNGLSLQSVALVFQTRAVDQRDLIHRLGELHPTTMAQVTTLLVAITS